MALIAHALIALVPYHPRMEKVSRIFTTTARILFHNSWETKLWKIAEALFRISSMTKSSRETQNDHCPYLLVPDHHFFSNFQKLRDLFHPWVVSARRYQATITCVLIATPVHASSYLCPHTETTIHRWNRVSSVGCTPAYGRCVSPNTVTRTISPPTKIEFLMFCTLNLFGSGTLKEENRDAYTCSG